MAIKLTQFSKSLLSTKAGSRVGAKLSSIKFSVFSGGGGAGGGGGGAAVGSGGFGSPELNELTKIRITLVSLLDLEKQHTKYLGDRIIKFSRTAERRKLKKREESQEKPKAQKGKSEAKKNPVVKGFLDGLQGLFSFFGNIFKAFLGYKILEWVAKPENIKKVQDFVSLIGNIFKFISAIAGFGIDRLLSGISKLVDGEGVTRLFGFLEAVVGFFTLKWLMNPTKIISDIKMIGNLFTKVIPNAINGIISFFGNLLPKAASDAADDALSQAGKQISGDAAGVAKGAATATEATGTAAKGAAAATKGAAAAAGKGAATGAKGATAAAAKGAVKGGAKVTGKTLLKALPVIGAVSSAFFAVDRIAKGDWLGAGGEVLSGIASLVPGWGTAASIGIDAALIGRDIAKEQGIPMLAEGGIVTKPTKAIVGEAGPEAIIPLDKIGSFAGLNKTVSDVIPKFMKLLTVPFTIVGAGIISLISSSLSMIPGIGPLLVPLISGLASSFGVPASIVSGLGKVASGAVKMVSGGVSGLAQIFGLKDPSVNVRAGSKFVPTKDTSIRGLLGNILGVLVSKLPKEKEQTPTNPPSTTAPPAPTLPAPATTPPTTPPSTTPPPAKPVQPANGGVGGYGTGDKIPALLEPGEYVLNRNAVKGVGGPAVLDRINNKMYPRFQKGGAVTLLTSGGGTSALATPVKFSMLRPHHGTGDSVRKYGITKDYIMDGSSYPHYKVPTPVDATVKFAGENPGGYGNMVELTDSKGAPLALFGHFSRLLVKTGDKITAGTALGIQGSTGRSSGPHVHIDASRSFHEAWSNYVLGVKTALDASSLVSGPGMTGQDTTTDTETQQEEPVDWTGIAQSLGNLFKQFQGTPEPTPTPSDAKPETKISPAPSQTSQTLQNRQKENNRLQAQSRMSGASQGGNVISLTGGNNNIESTSVQPISNSLGGNVPPIPQSLYPVAP